MGCAPIGTSLVSALWSTSTAYGSRLTRFTTSGYGFLVLKAFGLLFISSLFGGLLPGVGGFRFGAWSLGI